MLVCEDSERVDANGDGEIDFGEFCALARTTGRICPGRQAVGARQQQEDIAATRFDLCAAACSTHLLMFGVGCTSMNMERRPSKPVRFQTQPKDRTVAPVSRAGQREQ